MQSDCLVRAVNELTLARDILMKPKRAFARLAASGHPGADWNPATDTVTIAAFGMMPLHTVSRTEFAADYLDDVLSTLTRSTPESRQ